MSVTMPERLNSNVRLMLAVLGAVLCLVGLYRAFM